jgi:hypothetical protein
MTSSPVEWLPEPIRSWLGSISGLEFLAWVAGFVVAGWGVYKLGKKVLPGTVAIAKGVVNAAAILTAVQGLPEFIERSDQRHHDADQRHAALDKKVSDIHHEVHFNDGTSAKDGIRRTEQAVERIARSVEGLHGRMDTVESDVKALHRADAELRADLEQTTPPGRNH